MSSVGLLASVDGALDNDDEDVSLDELMVSDSNDEPEEATDVQSLAARSAREPLPEPEAAAAAAGEPAESAATSPAADDDTAAQAAAAEAQELAARAAAAEADARAERARRAADATAEPSDAESPPAVTTEANVAAADAESSGDAEPVSVAPAEAEVDAAAEEAAPPSIELDAAELDASPAAPAVAARAVDGPLPSFDIPEADATAAQAGGAARVSPPALAHLSEVSEDDDDDAVTHIGLPVVPESPPYPEPQAAGFQVADPAVAALHAFEPDLALADARRATTRVVPRVDPSRIQQQRLLDDTSPALLGGRSSGRVGAWLSGVFQRQSRPGPSHGDVSMPLKRRAAWLLDTVLPPLSLVLFGSGIGAGIMLLQPDRGAKAAQQSQAIAALQEAPSGKRPTTLAERAEAGEGDALFKITNMPANDRTSALTLALERGYQVQKLNEFKEFARLLEGPAGAQTPNLTARFLSYAVSPETMLPAFSHLLTWPGSTGPDVLYGVWEKAPGGSRAASLAQQLLHSQDQRAKATPALLTALDLRSATSCEDYLRVLPAVKRDGDQRCSATLRALKHRDGCGDDGKQDCFACLRDSSLLEDALAAIEGRVPPQL